MRDLENIGAVFESSADREKFSISLSVPSEKAEKAFGVVAHFFTYGPSAHYLIDESKEVAEISYEKHYSSPTSVLSELIHEAAYGDGTPYGSSFYAPSLEKLTGMDVLAFRSTNFKSGSTLIAASGVEAKSVQAWAETSFQSLPTGTIKAPSAVFVGGDAKLKADTDGAAYVALAFPVPAGDAGKPYEVLHCLLSSKLAGTAVSPFIAKYSHGGLIGVYASASSAETGPLLESAIVALKGLASGSSSIDSAKNQLALSKALLMEGESATSVLMDAMACGSTLANYTKYADVTTAAVSAAANAALKSAPAYAVLGSLVGTLSLEKITKLLK